MLRCLCVIVAVSMAVSHVQAGKLEHQVNAWHARTGVLGLSVAVWDGERLETAVAGLRYLGGEPVAVEDRFAVASVTKTFTAAAILALVERGAMGLDTPVSVAAGLDYGAEMTISSLLYHNAGVPEYIGGALSFETFLSEHTRGRSDWSSDEVVILATALPGAADAGFGYSNSHYAILGRVIERQTGLSLEQALEALIFEPFGLDSAALITATSETPDALGHSAMLGQAVGAPQFDSRLARELGSLGYAAGGAMITAGDLAIWGQVWLSGSMATNQVYSAPAGGAAFGVDADRISVGAGAYDVIYGHRHYRLHGGDGLGVTALVLYDPETNVSIAILQNDDAVRALGLGASGFLDELALEILAGRAD